MTDIKILIEIQHFEGCPNSSEMIKRVKKAIGQTPFDVNYQEILVETSELAQRLKFRGSPTVLINGVDLENMPEPQESDLACRYYKNGLPSVAQIKEFITDKLKEEE